MTNKTIEKCAEEAEHLGFAKYMSDKGTSMVIVTQEELDNLLTQATESGGDLTGE